MGFESRVVNQGNELSPFPLRIHFYVNFVHEVGDIF